MRNILVTSGASAQTRGKDGFAWVGRTDETINLSELRATGVLCSVRHLSKYSKDIIHVLDSDMQQPGSRHAVMLAALLTKSRDVKCIGPDSSMRSVRRRELVRNAVEVVCASAKNMVSALTAFLVLCWLNICPKVSTTAKQSGDALYLYPGVWGGFKVGGAIAHITGIVNAFIRSGQSLIYSSTWCPDGLSDAARFQQIPQISDWGFPAEANLYRLESKVFFSAGRAFEGQAIRFVYSRLTLGSFGAVGLARRLKVPLVIEFNGSEVWIAQNWGRGLRFRWLAEMSERVTLRHADLIVSVSRPLLMQLKERGIEPEKIRFHPNGVDTTVFDPERFSRTEISEFRAKFGIPADALVFGFVGTFGRWHGTDVLAASIVEILRSQGDWLEKNNVRFLIAGDGDRRPRFVELVSPFDKDELVCMPGFFPQEQGPLIMASCDVLIAPHVANEDGTPFFGSPIKVFEYLASGRPIIASDLDQIGEILSREGNSASVSDSREESVPVDPSASPAMLVRPGNEADLTNAILYAGSNSDWRASAGRAARAQAVQRHSWDQNVKQVLDFLSP